MPQLSKEETEQLLQWIIHESQKLDLEDLEPSLFANYVKSLVTRDVPTEAMISSLEDFLQADKALSFTNELQRRVESKDFHFEEEKKTPPSKGKEQAPSKEPVQKPKEKEAPKEVKKEKPKNEVKELSRYETIKRRPRNEEKEQHEEKPQKKKFEEKKDYKKYDRRRRFSSDESETESDEEKDTQQLSLANVDEEPEIKPKFVKERFIVFVAGLEEQYNTIGRIYKAFKQFGRIAGIEEDKANGVCFIEYSKLSYAYRAVKKGAKTLHNSLLRVEFANEPDPEAIAAIESELEEKRKAWADKQKQATQETAPPQLSEQEQLIKKMETALKQKAEAYAALGDNDIEQKEKLQKDIEQLTDMIDELRK